MKEDYGIQIKNWTTNIEIKENNDNIKYFLVLDDKIKDCLIMHRNEISNFLENIYYNKSKNI